MMHTKYLAMVSVVVAIALLSFVGCSNQPTDTKQADQKQQDGHAGDKHTMADHHEDHLDHKHDGKALTEQDVKLPDSILAGVARLTELHEEINHLVEHNELADVHQVAEEMAMVAKHMKQLTRQDLPEDSQTEAGRLCNQIAGYFQSIDDAADSGNKADVQAIHKKMKEDIDRLQALSK